MDRLPELGAQGPGDEDLVRYRKAFVTQQHAILGRVGEMFRGQDAVALRALLVPREDSEFITICAWCESVRSEEGRWIAIGHLVPRQEPFAMTHSLCPSCAERVFASLPAPGPESAGEVA